MHPIDEHDDAAQREMPRYVSHKQVWALEIAEVMTPTSPAEQHEPQPRRVTFKEPGYAAVFLPGEMFTRYVPVPGDFYVVYADGYKSFSPREAFVDGYHSLGEHSPYGMELERLRGILRSCVRGPDPVDLGNGEIIALHLPHKGGAGINDDLKQEIKRG
jgi:hypothetical protein